MIPLNRSRGEKKKKKKRLECDRKFSLLNFTASSFAWKKWSHARTHTRLVPSVYTKNLRWFHYLWAPSDILWALHGIGLGLSERDKKFLSFMFFKFYDVAKLPTCGVKTEPLRLPVKGRREPWIWNCALLCVSVVVAVACLRADSSSQQTPTVSLREHFRTLTRCFAPPFPSLLR